jgi:hypothetical protein
MQHFSNSIHARSSRLRRGRPASLREIVICHAIKESRVFLIPPRLRLSVIVRCAARVIVDRSSNGTLQFDSTRPEIDSANRRDDDNRRRNSTECYTPNQTNHAQTPTMIPRPTSSRQGHDRLQLHRRMVTHRAGCACRAGESAELRWSTHTRCDGDRPVTVMKLDLCHSHPQHQTPHRSSAVVAVIMSSAKVTMQHCAE